MPEQGTTVFLSFLSLKQNCFIEGPRKSTLFLEFLSLFEMTTSPDGKKGTLQAVQKNTITLQENLGVFLSTYGQKVYNLFGIRDFLKLVPENHFFIITLGKVTDTAKLNEYLKFLSRFHKEKNISDVLDPEFFNFGEILEDYNMSFFGQHRKVVGGEDKKEARVCRFCDTKINENNGFGGKVTFRKKAHAISEALGNKNVITKDECDHCNERFSESIEPSLVAYFELFRSLYGLEGKNGKKKLKGKNFELDPIEGLKVQYDGIIDHENAPDRLEMELETNHPIIPQNIYRCLTKFFLSVLDRDELIHFKKTMAWVNGAFSAEDLPFLSCVQHSNFYKERPLLVVYSKKSNKEIPAFIGELHYADQVYAYIIPYCEKDKNPFLHKAGTHKFWKKFNKFRPLYPWKTSDLSAVTPFIIPIKLSITNMKIGENTFVSYQDSNESQSL